MRSLHVKIGSGRAPVIHTRGGYDFSVSSGEFTRRIGTYRFFAKVTRVVRHGNSAEDVAGLLPFRPLEHWGTNRADAITQAIQQIDDWFFLHPNAEKNSTIGDSLIPNSGPGSAARSDGRSSDGNAPIIEGVAKCVVLRR